MELDRRGFLASIANLFVIAAMPIRMKTVTDVTPSPLPEPDLNLLSSVKAPAGLTYNWVRSALLGEPDPENVKRRLDAGWTFVSPSTHPELPSFEAKQAIEGFGLVLMQKPTELIKPVGPYPLPHSTLPLGEYERSWNRIDRQNYHYAKTIIANVKAGAPEPPNLAELKMFVNRYEGMVESYGSSYPIESLDDPSVKAMIAAELGLPDSEA